MIAAGGGAVDSMNESLIVTPSFSIDDSRDSPFLSDEIGGAVLLADLRTHEINQPSLDR